MKPSSQEAIEFARDVMSLADGLASRGIVIHSIDSNWGTFGSWVLVMQSTKVAQGRHEALKNKDYNAGPFEAVRAVWDGKENQLRIETAAWGVLTANFRFTSEIERNFDHRVDAERFAREYLERRLVP